MHNSRLSGWHKVKCINPGCKDVKCINPVIHVDICVKCMIPCGKNYGWNDIVLWLTSVSGWISGFPLSLGDLGDIGDQKYFYQWNSEKRNWNLNEFPIFPWNWVHFIQSNSDNGDNYINAFAFPILCISDLYMVLYSTANSLKTTP